MKRQASLCLLILIATCSNLNAYEVSTHETLNIKAAQSVSPNGFSLDAYLKLNLGFANGINEKLKGETIINYIGDGGIHEDDGHWYKLGSRYLNHFHNPLKPWASAGLSDILSGDSSLIWAQKEVGTQNPFGHYSWKDGRYYYYKALTETNFGNREQAFANTFRSVGQVMHLIEDASVPAHTRNDAHLFYNYEKWVDKNKGALNTDPTYSTAPLTNSIDGYVPITQFWDTNTYDGSNPLTGTDIGLAEYSNANFLSDDTIYQGDPNSIHYFPYPDKSLTELWVDNNNHRKYLRNFGKGEIVQHTAAVSFLYFYRLRYFPQLNSLLPLGLDDEVYKEQAEKLVPRAVGYAAGLINYFFRGTMNAEGLLKVDSNQTYSEIVFDVSNATPGETMGPGKLVVSYEFIPPDSNETPMYGVSDPIDVNQVPSDPETDRYTVPLNTEIPFGSKDIKFHLVFQGLLGAETGAVATSMITLCPGFCEDWEGGTGYNSVNQDVYLVKTQSGSLTTETANGDWYTFCDVYGEAADFSESRIVNLLDGNETQLLRLYMGVTNGQGWGACTNTYTFQSPVPLSEYYNLSFDIYYDVEYTNLLPLSYLDEYFVLQQGYVVIDLSGDLGLPQASNGPDYTIYSGSTNTQLYIYGHWGLLSSTYIGGLPRQWVTLEHDIRDILINGGGADPAKVSDAKINYIQLWGNFNGGRNTFFNVTYGFDNVKLTN